MKSEKPSLITPAGLITDLVLCGIFFSVFTFKIIPPHVPTYHPVWNFVFSAFTATVLTGVFFFALCYLRVTRVDEKIRKRKQAS